jgi:hypothetical protein
VLYTLGWPCPPSAHESLFVVRTLPTFSPTLAQGSVITFELCGEQQRHRQEVLTEYTSAVDKPAPSLCVALLLN